MRIFRAQNIVCRFLTVSLLLTFLTFFNPVYLSYFTSNFNNREVLLKDATETFNSITSYSKELFSQRKKVDERREEEFDFDGFIHNPNLIHRDSKLFSGYSEGNSTARRQTNSDTDPFAEHELDFDDGFQSNEESFLKNDPEIKNALKQAALDPSHPAEQKNQESVNNRVPSETTTSAANDPLASSSSSTGEANSVASNQESGVPHGRPVFIGEDDEDEDEGNSEIASTTSSSSTSTESPTKSSSNAESKVSDLPPQKTEVEPAKSEAAPLNQNGLGPDGKSKIKPLDQTPSLVGDKSTTTTSDGSESILGEKALKTKEMISTESTSQKPIPNTSSSQGSDPNSNRAKASAIHDPNSLPDKPANPKQPSLNLKANGVEVLPSQRDGQGVDSSSHCISMDELNLYYPKPKNLVFSDYFSKQINNYYILHRECTEGISDWTAQLRNGSGGSESQKNCKYIIPFCPSGMGNHLTSFISAFAYAILTNRVVLMGWSHMRQLLCNPFPYSSWTLPKSAGQLLWDSLEKGPRLKKVMELHKSGSTLESSMPSLPLVHLYLRWNESKVDQSFYCSKGQQVLEHVHTIVYDSDQYNLPGLYLIQEFRVKLFKMFPDRNPFALLSSLMYFPENDTWNKIKSRYAKYMSNVTRRVGIQVRTFNLRDEYAHSRVLECATKVARVLPIPPVQEKAVQSLAGTTATAKESHLEILDEFLDSKDHKSGPEIFGTTIVDPRGRRLLADPSFNGRDLGVEKISLFLTSLNSHHHAFFTKSYASGNQFEKSNGKKIQVLVNGGKHIGLEKHTLENDREAFIEIWLLSFSDSLLISDASTFGYVASGLSGVKTYLMNNMNGPPFGLSYHKNGRPVCELYKTTEPCFHFPPHLRPCQAINKPKQPPIPLGDFPPNTVEYCQDFPTGIVMVPKRKS